MYPCRSKSMNIFFFFSSRRRHTRLQGDWSSDVCSSDLSSGLTYKDRTTEEVKTVALEGIFVQIGLLPNTDWLKGTVELTRFGEIVIDAKGHTSVPGVFGAGDCTNVPYKQIIIAAGAGSTAALSAFDHLIRH